MRKKPVVQYTLEGKYIATYDSCKDASISLTGDEIHQSNIHVCCGGRTSTALGYKWLFKSDSRHAKSLFRKRSRNPRKHYKDEEIVAEASKYGSKSEFEKRSVNYYRAAKRRGILDALFERKLNPFSDNMYCVYAYEFKSTRSVYVGITLDKDRRKKNHRTDKESAVYKHSKENGIAIPEPRYIIDNTSIENALIQEDVYRKKYEDDGWNVLNKAKTGLKYGSTGTLATRKYSKKQLREAISKCKTRAEFASKYSHLYEYARNNKLLHELDVLEYSKVLDGTYNSNEAVFFEALQYDSLSDFRKGSPSAYKRATERGLLPEYFWLSNGKSKSVVISSVFSAEKSELWELLSFASLTELKRFFGFNETTSLKRILKEVLERGYEYSFL